MRPFLGARFASPEKVQKPDNKFSDSSRSRYFQNRDCSALASTTFPLTKSRAAQRRSYTPLYEITALYRHQGGTGGIIVTCARPRQIICRSSADHLQIIYGSLPSFSKDYLFPTLRNLAHVAGRDAYNLHPGAHVSRVGSVLCTNKYILHNLSQRQARN